MIYLNNQAELSAITREEKKGGLTNPKRTVIPSQQALPSDLSSSTDQDIAPDYLK